MSWLPPLNAATTRAPGMWSGRAGSFSDPRWLKAVLQVALHALPHAYRDVPGGSDRSVAILEGGPRGVDGLIAVRLEPSR